MSADWHALNVDDALRRLGVQPDGLTADEAAKRLARHGPNRLPPPPRRSALKRFLLQFHNFLIYVLLAAGGITAALGDLVDTAVIVGVVVVNAFVGFLQEGKAERALEAVRGMLALRATVLRDGRRQTIAGEALVPGDVVLLQSGDKVPADLRLMRAKNLRAQEAALTGESEPVDKRADAAAPDAPLGERSCMVYSGTLIAAGQATGVVVATATQTELGRISAMLGETPSLTTPLLRRIADFGRSMTIAIVALAAATFAFGILARDYSATDMFLTSVALAVAAIPEGLPAIISIVLAIGVQRMARRNAIIRHLPAVETLGAVTVICSDKTGTLTRNEMTVRSVVTAQAAYAVSGAGYDPRGGFTREGRDLPAADDPDLVEVLRAAALCNDAVLRNRDGAWSIEGDPTEGALLVAALKAGIDRDREIKDLPRTDEIPFESESRFMATLHHDHAGHGVVYVKGAPERVLAMCGFERAGGEDQPLDAAHWSKRVDDIAAAAQRVLAVAAKAMPADRRELTAADIGGLSLLGILGQIDPPRDEAAAAVRDCAAAGITVKMITGDHARTAAAIAAELGIAAGSAVLAGQDLDRLDDAELGRRVAEVDVFARTSPEHKLRLVAALQSRGHVVAMTGDGVNDAPALKRADIGIAMGRRGTEAAKEAAQMVLADDNFASIAHAVEEGRIVYDNLRKTILYILPTNGGEALTLIAAVLIGATMPMSPVQILWVNLITETTLSLAFAFEPPEDNVMRRAPRPPREPILSGFFVWRVVFVSLLMAAGVLGLFLWEVANGHPLAVARTAAVNAIVAAEMFYLFSARFVAAPSWTVAGITGSRPVLIAVLAVALLQIAFTYVPAMQDLFGTESLSLASWLRIAAVGAGIFVLAELEKAVLRRWRGRAISAPATAQSPRTGR